jgi:hypothetical protein
MKKWLVTASIIVVASSALCLPVTAEPKNERVLSAPSFEAWWIDIGGRRAFGTAPDVKLGELNGSGLLDYALADLYLRGVEKLSIAYAFDGVGTKDLTDVVTDDPRPLAFQGPMGGSPLVAQGE